MGRVVVSVSPFVSPAMGGMVSGRGRHPPAHYLPPAIEIITPERLLLGSERI